MNLVYLSSPKGGVGRTTLIASLSLSMQRLGYQVIAIDLDPQNSLRHHFGLDINDTRGLVSLVDETSDWSAHIVETASGVSILPYGHANRAHHRAFNHKITNQPNFLNEQLKRLKLSEKSIVFIDLPVGDSPALECIEKVASVELIVLQSDGESAVTLPLVMAGKKSFFIINKVSRPNHLNRDITELYDQKLGAALMGHVHKDDSVSEAFAVKRSIFDYAPQSSIIHDLDAISRSLSRFFEI